MTAYSDASYAPDINTRRSVLGGLVLLAGGPVCFFSSQYKVALSSGEAEYCAASETTRDIKWLSTLLDWLKIGPVATELRIDNTAAISLIKNKAINKRSKHIEVQYHFVRQQYHAKLFNIVQVGTEEQVTC